MAGNSTEPEKKRKRPRAARACELCRTKKYRCDESYPCAHCRRLNTQCVYKGDETIRRRLASSSYVAELERRVKELSERLPVDSTPLSSFPNQSTPQQSLRDPNHTNSDADFAEDDDDDDDDDSDCETRDVNPHTHNVEFHGKTSSLAFLASIQPQKCRKDSLPIPAVEHSSQTSLVSTLHNAAFVPEAHTLPPSEQSILEHERYYFRQSHHFLEGYFENLHYIHPVIDKTTFLTRCEDLWFGRAMNQPRTFIALYCSVMSLGALIRIWDEDHLDGLTRFQWSRKLFNHARNALGELRSTNDVETVQCLLVMAKVCQNELNPHLAYMHLGMATRAALSAGFNCEPARKRNSRPSSDVSIAISRTWWGLYSLEMEMSFSLGRPDSLGLDDYHNRQLPPLQDNETGILTLMIRFARLTRKVSISIYLKESSVQDKAIIAAQIETEMEDWLNTLPEKVRPTLKKESDIKNLRDPQWARRQRLALTYRYLNVRMILYRPFLLCAARNPHRLPDVLRSTVSKCVEAATITVETMHDAFCQHVFFRSWWYNTTYTLYASSILLCYATQVAPISEKPHLFKLVDMTIEILEVMDDSVVARKTAEMIRQILSNARENMSSKPIQAEGQPLFDVNFQRVPRTTAADLAIDALVDLQMPSLYSEPEFDMSNSAMPFDDMQFMLWADFPSSFQNYGV